MNYPFNVRVYGLLLNEQDEILISDERQAKMYFSKFPGGGLEYGEGTIEALKREFLEECDLAVEVQYHYYTTDFFIQSAFNNSQVIGIYYWVKALQPYHLSSSKTIFDFDKEGKINQVFRWIPIKQLTEEHLTFPADKKVAQLISQTWKKNQ